MISDNEDRIRDMKISNQKLHEVGLPSTVVVRKYFLNLMLIIMERTNQVIVDQRVTDKANKEYIAKS